VGDALGAPVEFMSFAEIRAAYGDQGVLELHPAYGRLGAITDDTQMTLFTAEGLLRSIVRRKERGIGGAEVGLVKDAYLRWLKTQRRAGLRRSRWAPSWRPSRTGIPPDSSRPGRWWRSCSAACKGFGFPMRSTLRSPSCGGTRISGRPRAPW
jgi:hypothetical protein